MRMSWENADTGKARIYFPASKVGKAVLKPYVRHYADPDIAYAVFVALPKGIRCAFRGANDCTPVYEHDLVDAR